MNLSDFEIDVMNVIWRKGECSAPEVHEEITREKDVTYSTVKTIIDRLEKKGAVTRARSEGRTIFIQPEVSPESIQESMLDRLVNHVFAGQRRPLFTHLLRDDDLSVEDVEYIEGLLRERQGKLTND